MSDISAQTYMGARAVSQSDTVSDTNGPFVALQATTAAGLVKITTAIGDVATIYLPLGVPINMNVIQVWTSVTTATGIVGFVAKPFKTRGM